MKGGSQEGFLEEEALSVNRRKVGRQSLLESSLPLEGSAASCGADKWRAGKMTSMEADEQKSEIRGS